MTDSASGPEGAERAGEALIRLTRRFSAAGMETPALDARVLLLHVTGMSHAALIAHPERVLSPKEAARLEDCAARRVSGEPVSRITGRREFYGREFLITPDVLDPRPDSETLVEAALEAARRLGANGRALRIADLGAGSGAIIVTLLAELPGARGLAVDISRPALDVTLANARVLGVAGRLGLHQGGWLEGVSGPFDMIVSNPPYIASGEIAELAREVREHDPLLALDGGADGLEAYRALAGQAGAALAAGGFLLVEAGAGQAEAVESLFLRAGFAPEGGFGPWFRDLSGVRRVLALRKK